MDEVSKYAILERRFHRIVLIYLITNKYLDCDTWVIYAVTIAGITCMPMCRIEMQGQPKIRKLHTQQAFNFVRKF